MVKVDGFTIEREATYTDFVSHDFLFPMQFSVDMQQIGEDTLRLTYRIRYLSLWKGIDEVKDVEKLPCGCSGDRECTEAVHLWNAVKVAYEAYWGWRNNLSDKDKDAEEASRWQSYLNSLAAYRRHKESQRDGS